MSHDKLGMIPAKPGDLATMCFNCLAMKNDIAHEGSKHPKHVFFLIFEMWPFLDDSIIIEILTFH